MKRFRLNSFATQLFLWILLSSLALVVLLSGVSYQYTIHQIDLRVGEAAQRNISQAMESYTLQARGYDSLTKSITGNIEIQRLIAQEETIPSLQMIKDISITNLLGSIFYSYHDVKGIHIITNAGNVYSYESVNHPLGAAFMKGEWFKELQNSDGGLVWGGILQEPLTVRDDTVFTFGRKMYNLYTRQPLGVLLIEADPRTFLISMNNLTIGPKSRTFVFSDTNQLLVSSDSEGKLPTDLPDLTRYMFKDEANIVNDKKDMIVIARDPLLGWKVVNITPKPVTKVEYAKVNRFFIVVTGTLLVIAIALATFLSRSISRPIKNIVHEMRRVERGNLSPKMMAVKSYDELNYLMDRFHSMVGEINQLVERVRIAAASEKNAQIYALQSQINPHFLYNTLEMIYWLLDEQENEQLAELVLSLSRMFRYSSDWSSSSASLKNELEQINHYLTIIQVRSDGRIRVENVIDEQWLSTPIPKMTLQPLIENAIIHGLSEGTDEGIVRISSSLEGQTLHVHIQDTGKGISPAKQNELKQSLKQAEKLDWNRMAEEEKHGYQAGSYGEVSRSGSGLINVHRRLILEYGMGYGLHIQSKESFSTTITVDLPILRRNT
ncbi:cache domain-containing sensor histidine kinase [Paenibacillus sp. LPE1-1-1.1]|uniref:cache domain-containing sensor histidine kinase n=1 Tax=Paenibacillus sp. LPE1-1-1.1 TaxID=3135230 RepID=UPI00342A8B9C